MNVMFPLRNLNRFVHKAIQQPVYALGVLGKRICASLAYMRSDGTSCLPEALTLYLTGQCNLRCRMCGQWGDVGIYRHSVGRGMWDVGRERGGEDSMIPYELAV
jgi:hypothetical protein